MPPVEKLLVLAGVGRNIYVQWRLQHMISSIIMIAGLTIVASVLTSLLLIGGLYFCYIALINFGIASMTAMMAVGVILLTATVISIGLIRMYIRRLRETPRKTLGRTPIAARVGETVDAFIDGLLAD